MKKTLIALLLPFAAFAQNGYEGPGRYEILSNLSQKVLDLDRNDQRTIIQYESRGTDNQTWDIQDAGGGFVYIRNGMNGYALTQTRANNSEPVAGQQANNSDAQRWRLESASNGAVLIVNASGKALDIPYGKKDNGVKINTYNKNGEINQQWTLRRVAGYNTNTQNQPGYNNRRDQNRQNRQARQDRQNQKNQQNYPNAGNSRYDDNNQQNQQNRRPGGGVGNRDAKYFDQNANMWKMDGDGACFYTQPQYKGEAFCVVAGDQRQRADGDSGHPVHVWIPRSGRKRITDDQQRHYVEHRWRNLCDQRNDGCRIDCRAGRGCRVMHLHHDRNDPDSATWPRFDWRDDQYVHADHAAADESGRDVAAVPAEHQHIGGEQQHPPLRPRPDHAGPPRPPNRGAGDEPVVPS